MTFWLDAHLDPELTLELQALLSRHLPEALEALKRGEALVEILGN
jgi:hypothetical protein